MRRHNARILAVLTLYNLDLNMNFGEQALKTFEDIQEVEMQYEYQVDIDYDYSRHLILEINEHLSEIDEMISSSLKNYTIDRLSYVDRAIIRLATYEMCYAKIAKEVAINEALLITREYSNLDDDSQVKFNNRLLENISNSL